jgi:hypothetical protein
MLLFISIYEEHNELSQNMIPYTHYYFKHLSNGCTHASFSVLSEKLQHLQVAIFQLFTTVEFTLLIFESFITQFKFMSGYIYYLLLTFPMITFFLKYEL